MLGQIKSIVLHSTNQKRVYQRYEIHESASEGEPLFADAERIKQIMLNLIENAV
jgi:signal transduction histidine kinase